MSARRILSCWVLLVTLVHPVVGQDDTLGKRASRFGLESSADTPAFGKDTPVNAWNKSDPTMSYASAKVGDFGDLDRLAVEGAQTFTTQQIRDALRGNVAVRLASHPAGPCSKLTALVRTRTLLGYQHAGFPDAMVDVNIDIAQRQLTVRVEEGVRFMTGEVRIEGGKTLAVEKLVARLTQPYPPEDAMPASFLEVGGQTVVGWTDKDGKSVDLQLPVWQKGEPAKIDATLLRSPRDRGAAADTSSSRLHGLVQQAFADLGYYFPDFSVAIILDPPTHQADLLVQLVDEGPQAVIGGIEVLGNERDTRDDVLTYLAVKPGMTLSREELIRLKRRLWQSGRYVTSNVVPVRPATAGDKLLLRIELVEVPKAPPLRNPLTQEEEVFLKLRDFLANSDRWPGDLVIDVEVDACRGAIVVSPKFGALISATGSVTAEPPIEFDHAWVATQEECSFYAPRRGALFRTAIDPERQVNLVISAGLVQSAKEKEISQNFGIGMTTPDRKKGKKPGQTRPPLATSLDVQPSLFLGCVQGKNVKSEIRDGVMTLDVDGDILWRIDAASGRLIEWRVIARDRGDKDKKDNEKADEEQGDKDKKAPPALTGTLRMRFEPGELQRRLAALHAAAGEDANAYEPQRPFSSLLAFLCDDPLVIWSTHKVLGESRGLGLVRRLAQRGVLGPLDRLLTDDLFPDNPFTIPSQKSDLADFTPMQIYGCLGLQICDELVPRSSWPWTLGQETGLFFMGKTEHADAELSRLVAAKDSGPLCMLVLGNLLERLKSPAALVVAARGLRLLSSERFSADCRPLLDKEHVLGKCLREAAAIFRRLDEEDIAAFGRELDAESAGYLDACARVLRGDPDRPLDEAMPEVIDALWQAGLKDRLESALKAIQDRAPAGSKEAT